MEARTRVVAERLDGRTRSAGRACRYEEALHVGAVGVRVDGGLERDSGAVQLGEVRVGHGERVGARHGGRRGDDKGEAAQHRQHEQQLKAVDSG